MLGHVKKSTGVSNLLDSDVSPGGDVSNSDQSSISSFFGGPVRGEILRGTATAEKSKLLDN